LKIIINDDDQDEMKRLDKKFGGGDREPVDCRDMY
jgi:hypothetical protein